MKIAFWLLALVLGLGCTACQSGRFGASTAVKAGGGSGMEDNATEYGHAESALVDYSLKLADPGPF